jgi:hypothetical protein
VGLRVPLGGVGAFTAAQPECEPIGQIGRRAGSSGRQGLAVESDDAVEHVEGSVLHRLTEALGPNDQEL